MEQTCRLKNSTVVITGATSGIGRGSALLFAKEGANVVLASRNEETLLDIAQECEKYGAKSLVVVTDVTDSQAVSSLAKKAVDEFGSIDVWVNDAGVGAVGAYDEVPMDDHKQVVATNLLGYMNGTHAVLPYFKKQKYGTIINLNSLGAWIPSPYAAAYTASKFGLRGFTQAIRGELRNWSDIHVCDVFPAFVGSPGMKHGANYTGVEMKPVHPYVSAHKVASVVVELAINPKPVQMVSLTARLGKLFGSHAPAFFAGVMAALMEYHIKHGKKTPMTQGNLFVPTPKKTAHVEGSYDSMMVTKVAIAGGLAGLGILAWKLNQQKIAKGQAQLS